MSDESTFANRMLAIVMFAIAASISAGAQAQRYPSKPVRIVVPFAAGGAQDAVARSVNNELAAALGQPFIVENRPGAGGVVGTLAVAKAAADGYTLLLAGASHQINAVLYPKAAYRPLQDFTPVSYIESVDYLLIVSGAVPVQSVPDFIRYAKAQPGALSYASDRRHYHAAE
jgi:tripartite-type tricarboxylate transporter receptor subunit TctC